MEDHDVTESYCHVHKVWTKIENESPQWADDSSGCWCILNGKEDLTHGI